MATGERRGQNDDAARVVHVSACLEGATGDRCGQGPAIRTAVVRYLATEAAWMKQGAHNADASCNSNGHVDGAECDICFEEYKTDDNLVHLVCLCRYYEHCVLGWWSAQ